MTIIASAHVPASSRLVDAPTADLSAVRTTSDLDRQAYTLLDAGTPVSEAAAQLGVSEAEAVALSIDHVARQTGWDRGVGLRPVNPYENRPGNPTLCPTWCPGTCGNTAERAHVRPIVDMTGRHGDLVARQVEIRAQLQTYESPDLPGGIEPAEVLVQMMNADDNGGTSTALTLDEAEKLGQALVDAARTARQARPDTAADR